MRYLIIWCIVVASSIAGGSLALVNHGRLKLSFDLPAALRQKATQLTSSIPLQIRQNPFGLSVLYPSNLNSASRYDPIAPAQTAVAPIAARQPIVLRDEVIPGSAFDQFRSQFRQAVRDRSTAFVKGLFPAQGVSIGFSVPQSVEQLGLENPDARFWSILEKSLQQGCAAARQSDYPSVDAHSQVWICPNVTPAFYQQYPNPSTEPGINYEISRVIVVGDGVNVRAQASTNSAIVGTLSNEVMQFDRQAFENFSVDQREAMLNPINGWTPVILPNGQRGFVSSRYAYQPLEPRLILGQVGGAWKIVYIPSGD